MSKDKTVTISGREYPLSYVVKRGESAIAASLKGAASVSRKQRATSRKMMEIINAKRRWEKEQEKDEQNNMEQGKRRRATA